MKKFFLIPLLALGLTSCGLDDIKDAISSITVPKEATPTKSFTLTELPAEPYADKALHFTTSAVGAPFTTIEFLGDGQYIIERTPLNRANSLIETLSGTFTMSTSFQYVLDNGDVIDVSSLDGTHGTISYTPADGEAVSVNVTSDPAITSPATAVLCRTWSLATSKYWFSVKGICALYRGYEYKNGQLTHEDNRISDALDGLFEGDPVTLDKWPEYVSISPFGTYFVRFADGKTVVQQWKWENEGSGIIKTISDATNFNLIEFLKDHSVSVRFTENKMQLYTEYNISTTRVLNANTFVAN